jgi:heme-degrading monooxygenase HmoA
MRNLGRLEQGQMIQGRGVHEGVPWEAFARIRPAEIGEARAGSTLSYIGRDDSAVEENTMFIAMNRFQVIRGEEQAFENVWLSRDTYLDGVPGFIEFHLLRGPAEEDHTLFSSHTLWRSREDFEAWTKSENFRQAHRNAGDNKPLYLGHPRFEGFEVIQTVAPQSATA